MPIGLVSELARGALTMAVLMAGPMLAIALIVGLVISILQAVTSIQEQTIAFVPKLFAVGAIFLILFSWMLNSMVKYTTELFRGLPGLVG